MRGREGQRPKGLLRWIFLAVLTQNKGQGLFLVSWYKPEVVVREYIITCQIVGHSCVVSYYLITSGSSIF